MLELKNVSWSVEDENGSNEIINDVSLTLDEHKLYVITGPNGGGKSTLAKLIMGILTPTGGQIILTVPILPICPLPTGQSCKSAMPSKHRRYSRASPYRNC